MKYSEAAKAIKGLSKKYSINNNGKFVFELIYKSKPIACVDKQEQFNFGRVNTFGFEFDKLPYSHKLWMILAELSMTPLDKRKEEHKWNVIIANNPNNGESPYTAWFKAQNGYGVFYYSKQELTVFEQTTFTDKEFDNLIKYIKTVPDGEYQAKIAEHGKTLVKGE